MAAHEGHHWWFVGRRAVVAALMTRLDLPPEPDIVEAGCGTGGNLQMLAARGTVSAFEPFDEAAAVARSRYPTLDVRHGELPDVLPFPEASYDLVAALDVLEHVRDDQRALEALVALARPGGWVIVTVPAHQALWGSHDRRLHHRRRYGRRQLEMLAESTGAEIVYVTAFNTFLAPIAMAYRLIERVVGRDLGNQERIPPRWINAALATAFALERHFVTRSALPAGLSYAAILRRPTTPAAPRER